MKNHFGYIADGAVKALEFPDYYVWDCSVIYAQGQYHMFPPGGNGSWASAATGCLMPKWCTVWQIGRKVLITIVIRCSQGGAGSILTA